MNMVFGYIKDNQFVPFTEGDQRAMEILKDCVPLVDGKYLADIRPESEVFKR